MMKHWILVSTVVAFVILGEVAISLVTLRPPDDVLLGMVLLALIPSHAGLVSLWAALAGTAGPWRLVIALIAVVSWAHVSTPLGGAGGGSEWMLVLLLLVGLESALLLAARFFGVELTNTEVPKKTDDPDLRWMQFTLLSMLSWTTAWAVMLATLHYVPEDCIPESLEFQGYFILAAICFGAALVSLSAIWLVLGSRWPLGRWMALAACVLIAVVSLWAIIPVSNSEVFFEVAVFFASMAFWLIVPLWLLRKAGYWLVWRRRVTL